MPESIATELIVVTRVSGTEIRVEWEPPTLVQSRGFILFYHVTYEANTNGRMQDSEVVSVPGNQLFTDLDGLNPNTGYSIAVVAENSAGLGESSGSVIIGRKLH